MANENKKKKEKMKKFISSNVYLICFKQNQIITHITRVIRICADCIIHFSPTQNVHFTKVRFFCFWINPPFSYEFQKFYTIQHFVNSWHIRKGFDLQQILIKLEHRMCVSSFSERLVHVICLCLASLDWSGHSVQHWVGPPHTVLKSGW